MIPIAPNGEVRILENIPFDREHTHTCLFASKAAQTTYMLSKSVKSLSSMSYQRASRQSIRVQVKIDDVYNANYLMFRNTAFENKWIYAFITDVAYINNVTTEIQFEIDALQTWLFDFELGDCFVEREHSVSDVAGDNIVPEQVNLGDYEIDHPTRLPGLYSDDGSKKCRYVLWSTVHPDGSVSDLTDTWGVMLGVSALEASTNIVQALEGIGKLDGIVGLSPVPTEFMLKNQKDPTYAPSLNFTIPKRTYCFESFGGYTPKNKKLYTYPYNFLAMNGFNGNSAEYAFEYFTAENGAPLDNCPFSLLCSISPSTTLGVVPGEYKGHHLTDGSYPWNYEEMIKIYTFPQMPFSIDVYKNELGTNLITGTMSTLKAGVSGAIAGGGVGAAIGAGFGILDIITSLAVSSRQPGVMKGSWDDYFLYANNLVGGWYARKRIKREFAEMIDGYFNMFGYATKCVKTPNINSRPHWNYVKTLYCYLNGDLPESAESEIRACFNRGITFWKNPGEIGNYSLDNSPT